MPRVAGQDRIAEIKRGDSDLQIGKRNDLADLTGFGIHLRRHLSHLLREWPNQDHPLYLVNVLAALQGQPLPASDKADSFFVRDEHDAPVTPADLDDGHAPHLRVQSTLNSP